MVEVYIQIFDEIWTLWLTPVSAYQFSGKLRDKKCSYCHRYIMVQMYIQIFWWNLNIVADTHFSHFSSLPSCKEVWVKMMEFFFANFFHWFILGSPNSTIQELLGAGEGFMIGKLDF